MKKLLLVGGLLLGLGQLWAQGTAKVVVYRPKAWTGSSMRAKLTLGKQQVILRSGYLVEVEVPAGDYYIQNEKSAWFLRKLGYMQTFEAGKTYYLRYRFIRGNWYSSDEFILVDAGFGAKDVARMPLKQSNAKPLN